LDHLFVGILLSKMPSLYFGNRAWGIGHGAWGMGKTDFHAFLKAYAKPPFFRTHAKPLFLRAYTKPPFFRTHAKPPFFRTHAKPLFLRAYTKPPLKRGVGGICKV
jgi:hypothetical protein